jgi:hypothetical protein
LIGDEAMSFFSRNKRVSVINYDADMQKKDSYLNVVFNAMRSLRRQLGGGHGISPDGKRNFNQLFGYGEHLTYTDYYLMYRRGGIAKAVVEKLPKSCWRDIPTLKVGEKDVLKSELEELKNNGFFDALERADILNRIGNFSVLVMGMPDSEELEKPLGSASTGNFEAMYFHPYGYNGIEILKKDNDPASSRFGLPELYQVQTIAINTCETKDINPQSYKVHWSRILHLAEGALESTIEGCSALEAPWNAITDSSKISGSAAESFYRNSRQKMALEANENAQFDMGEEALKKLKENVEGWQDGFEDTLRLSGMKANMLQPQIASPRDAFDVSIEIVSGTTGIPVRILTTKSGGSVTGQEDKGSWNALIKDRQESVCTLWLMIALKRMHEVGLLVLPKNVKISWPPLSAVTEREASEITEKKAIAFEKTINALSQLVASDVDVKSVFAAIGLEGIEIDNSDLDDSDIDEPETEEK